MKPLFFLLFTLLFTIGSFAQNLSVSVADIKLSDWSNLLKNDQVEIAYKMLDCNKPMDGLYAEYAILSLKNKTAKTLIISWQNEVYYNNKCASCGNESEYTYQLTLKPNETIIPNCDLSAGQGLKVFSKWTQTNNVRTLTQINITNLSVKEE